jgi:hypothetical protein
MQGRGRNSSVVRKSSSQPIVLCRSRRALLRGPDLSHNRCVSKPMRFESHRLLDTDPRIARLVLSPAYDRCIPQTVDA